jgi:hypothetical protein
VALVACHQCPVFQAKTLVASDQWHPTPFTLGDEQT